MIKIPGVQRYNILTNSYSYICPSCGSNGEYINKDMIKEKNLCIRCYNCNKEIALNSTTRKNYFEE